MLTWIIGPALITLGFVAAIAATLIARRRRTKQGRIVATMHERSVAAEKAAAARHAQTEHRHAS